MSPEYRVELVGRTKRSEIGFHLLEGEVGRDFKDAILQANLASAHLRTGKQWDIQKAAEALEVILPWDIAYSLTKAAEQKEEGAKVIFVKSGTGYLVSQTNLFHKE